MGFEVWVWKGFGLDRCFPSVFGIVAKFPRRKSDSISPYFHGGNLVALCLRCIIAHKTLFSPSFWSENTVMGMPHFHGKNPAKFFIWCAMAHRQGFMLVYTMPANVLMLGRAGAPQSIKHVDTWSIHGETNVTWWQGSWRSHRGDYAHSMTRICTYSNRLEHILMPQGQKHPWPKKVTHKQRGSLT